MLDSCTACLSKLFSLDASPRKNLFILYGTLRGKRNTQRKPGEFGRVKLEALFSQSMEAKLRFQDPKERQED
jgi:hypothetical protein